MVQLYSYIPPETQPAFFCEIPLVLYAQSEKSGLSPRFEFCMQVQSPLSAFSEIYLPIMEIIIKVYLKVLESFEKQ